MTRGERADTIVAVSSAAGSAERAIVRMSGPGALPTAAGLFRPDDGPPVEGLPDWSVTRGVLRVAAFVAGVPALLYLMRAPRSYTREDVVEFHVVGSPAVASALLSEICARGVRLAGPGEFTERAFLSGRIDLTRAEAVLKLIHASGDAERKLALAELDGELSGRIESIAGRLLDLLTAVELSLDFSEDEVPVIECGTLADGLDRLSRDIDRLERSGAADYVFRETPRVAIVGRTNVGKSSLFNRLLGRDEAIVTPVSGATRDLLEAELALDGLRSLLVDTAGERYAAGSAAAGPARSGPAAHPDDIALERARAELERADLLLLVIDASSPLDAIDMTLLDRLTFPLHPTGGEGKGEGWIFPSPLEGEGAGRSSAKVLIVLNKSDLAADPQTGRTVRTRGLVVSVSCVTGAGLDRLRDELRQAFSVRGVDRPGMRFLLNVRQVDSLRSARGALQRAAHAARDAIGLEFSAAEIRAALDLLRDLTHPIEDLILDRIFSRFCIGK